MSNREGFPTPYTLPITSMGTYSKFAEYGTGRKDGTVDFQPNQNRYFQNSNAHVKHNTMPNTLT